MMWMGATDHNLLAYVNLNPVAARIVEDPAAYEWSGHAALIGRRSPVLIDRHAALRGFDETPKIAREISLDQVRNVAEARWPWLPAESTLSAKCEVVISGTVQDIREVIPDSYRIVYRVRDNQIVVLTIFEGRRLLPGSACDSNTDE